MVKYVIFWNAAANQFSKPNFRSKKGLKIFDPKLKDGWNEYTQFDYWWKKDSGLHITLKGSPLTFLCTKKNIIWLGLL